MKIYQLYEYGGQWEDAFEYIIGSYMRKERADEEKLKAEQKETERIKQYKRCNNCPINDNDLQSETLEYAQHTCHNYCGNAQILEDKFGYDCENYAGSWEESKFRIIEVEVEE